MIADPLSGGSWRRVREIAFDLAPSTSEADGRLEMYAFIGPLVELPAGTTPAVGEGPQDRFYFREDEQVTRRTSD
ncbi:hypothetical protein ACWF9G_27225 [Nocardia sp. NPDC055029]